MRFSTRIRYGVRAMVDIAMVAGEEGVLQKDIAQRQGISNKYLDHIITALKVAQLIKNAKGKKSGYLLSRPAAQISMLDMHNAFEPGINVVDCLAPGHDCPNDGLCASQTFWCRLNKMIVAEFSQTSLQQLVDEQLKFGEFKMPDGKVGC
jgi:Rrf2 family protein